MKSDIILIGPIGAGHSVFEDATLFQRVRQALAYYSNYTKDKTPEETCIEILNAIAL